MQMFQLSLVYSLVQVVSHILCNAEVFTSVPRARDNNRKPTKFMDWAYSPAHLMHLAKLEQILSKAEENIPPQFTWWINEYRQNVPTVSSSSRSGDNAEILETVAGHPFLTLRMMKRLSRMNEILKLKSYTDDDARISGFYGSLKTFQSEFILPSQADVENIVKSILEVQFMYDLNTDDLFHGIFGDVSTKVPLTLEEAYEIGSLALHARLFPEALEWLETIHGEMQKVPDSSTSLSRNDVFQLILNVTREHDALIDKLNNTKHLVHDHYHRFANKINSNHKLVTLKEYDVWKFKKSQNLDSFPAYSLLCSGQGFRAASESAKVYCYLEKESNFAWTINPLKVEVHNWAPYIVQFHDIVGDTVIQELTKDVLYKMERGTIAKYDESGSSSGLVNVSMLRTCSSGVLSEYAQKLQKVIQSLDKKIEKVTQLFVSNVNDPYSHASEQFKITSYAIGGQFYPHMDAFGGRSPDDTDVFGDRLATFMIYLNNVQRGGNTVFPLLGIHIPPEKGSALFWYDLLKNGKPDTRTLHAGCPVVLGQKWIASKWIRHGANFRTKQCFLNKSE